MRWLPFSLTQNHKTVINQTAIQIIGKVITVIGSFLVVRMVSSQAGLGLEGFGSYALVTGFVAYFYLLLDFGFNTVFVQRAHQYPDQQSKWFSELLSLRIILSIALIFFGLAILSFLPEHSYTPAIKVAIMFCLGSVLLQGLFMTGNAYFQLTLKYQLSVLIAIIASAVNLAITFIAMSIGAGLSGVLLAYITEYALLGLLSIVVVRRFISWRFSFNLAAWRHLIIESTPLGLSILLTMIYFRSDMFLLSVLPLKASLGLTNRQAVSLYSMPYAFFEVFLTLPAFIMNATYPLMLKAYSQSRESLKRLMWQTIIGSLIVAIGLILAIWVLAPIGITLQTANNPDFYPAISTLRILSLALPAFFVTNVLVFTLISLGKKKMLPLVYVLAGIFNISANLWLIPARGIVAAAVITGLTEMVILLLLIGLVWLAFGQADNQSKQEVANS